MIQWTEPAERDLDNHYRFMVMTDVWNPDAVVNRIMDAVEELVVNPKMGRHIQDDRYKLVLKEPKYVIHYYVDSDIFITRVFHHRQNREL